MKFHIFPKIGVAKDNLTEIQKLNPMIMKKKILGLIDFDRVNILLEGFNQSTGFVTAILDLEGNILSRSGWRQACTMFHRKHLETSQRCVLSDTILSAMLEKGARYHYYKCLNGLVDVAVPIVIKDEHIANLFSGQFFFEEPDLSYFKKQAERFGFDEEEYLNTIREVPVIPEEKVKTTIGFLLNMTHVISDMTFQKMELMELNDALKVSEERHRLILENSMDAILLTSPEGKIISANPAACTMFMRTEEEICREGRDGLVDQTDPRLQLLIDERDRTGRAKGELTMIRKDGSKFPVELSTSVFSDQSGSLRSSMSIRDITERKRTEAQLLIAKEKAEESDRLKTAFLQNMSHEIRTPMNAIMGFSGLLRYNFDNKQKLEQFTDIINQRSNDLLDILNDILDIAKIESGQLQVNIEECNINDLFGELYSVFTGIQNRSGKKHIELDLKRSPLPENVTIFTDKVKLKQILINLISNAIKFTDSGRIEAGYSLDGDNILVFYVSDTGIGIPSDKQDIIFERFCQLNQNPKNSGGTGLGLPIAKGLVNLLGGEIKVESEPGRGSTFSFSIPYWSKQSLSGKQSEIDMSASGEITGKTILIIEDDLYNAEYIRELLNEKGFKTIHAVTGEEALEKTRAQKIDLVLMDIRLPGIDGYESARKLLNENPGLKIIAQTAYAFSDEKQKAFDAGCIDYLSKPTKPEVLISSVKKHLA